VHKRKKNDLVGVEHRHNATINARMLHTSNLHMAVQGYLLSIGKLNLFVLVNKTLKVSLLAE